MQPRDDLVVHVGKRAMAGGMTVLDAQHDDVILAELYRLTVVAGFQDVDRERTVADRRIGRHARAGLSVEEIRALDPKAKLIRCHRQGIRILIGEVDEALGEIVELLLGLTIDIVFCQLVPHLREGLTLAGLDAIRKGPLIIKERVRTIGGELVVESIPGKGTRLEVSLPKNTYE